MCIKSLTATSKNPLNIQYEDCAHDLSAYICYIKLSPAVQTQTEDDVL